jgi:hypothetical protein
LRIFLLFLLFLSFNHLHGGGDGVSQINSLFAAYSSLIFLYVGGSMAVDEKLIEKEYIFILLKQY